MANPLTCYYSEGSISPEDTPCHSPSLGDGASACCNAFDVCLGNILCLAQHGSEVITRGSCTDQTWQSPECPQYCADVNPSGGAITFLMSFTPTLFCCSQGNPYDNTCRHATKGSTAPFPIDVGLVIFNRTSGSTFSNTTNDATVTVTATAAAAPTTVTTTATALALASASDTPSNHIRASSSSSTGKEAAIGAGVGGMLGLALCVTLVILWRQKKQKQRLSEDVQIWENRYRESMTIKTGVIGGAEHQPPHRFNGWNSDASDGQPHRPREFEGWSPDEIDGTQLYEVANRMRRD